MLGIAIRNWLVKLMRSEVLDIIQILANRRHVRIHLWARMVQARPASRRPCCTLSRAEPLPARGLRIPLRHGHPRSVAAERPARAVHPRLRRRTGFHIAEIRRGPDRAARGPDRADSRA